LTDHTLLAVALTNISIWSKLRYGAIVKHSPGKKKEINYHTVFQFIDILDISPTSIFRQKLPREITGLIGVSLGIH